MEQFQNTDNMQSIRLCEHFTHWYFDLLNFLLLGSVNREDDSPRMFFDHDPTLDQRSSEYNKTEGNSYTKKL